MSPGWWSLSSLPRPTCCGGLPPQRHCVVAGRPHSTATCFHAMGCLANAHVEEKSCQQRCSKKSVRYRNCHVQEHPQKPTWGSVLCAVQRHEFSAVCNNTQMCPWFIKYFLTFSYATWDLAALFSMCLAGRFMSRWVSPNAVVQVRLEKRRQSAAPPKEPTQ